MAVLHAYDTLGYSKVLIEGGFSQKQAETLATANKEFLSEGLATKEFVRSEILSSENRLTATLGKMIAVAVGILLAGIPLIQALLQKLG